MKQLLLATTFLICTSVSASKVARFYFAYGEQDLAALNQSTLGAEISSGGAFKVRTQTSFRVRLCVELFGFETPSSILSFNTNIAFDRSIRAEAEAWNFLDLNAFRKIRPAHADLTSSISNFQSFAAFGLDGVTPIDENNDGIQDRAKWTVVGGDGVTLFGTSGPGVTLRPVGIGASIFGITESGQTLATMRVSSGRYHLWDYEFTNNMVIGETYGYGEGETGLWVYTNPPYGSNNSTSFGPRDGSISYNGARYNILAVPEPSGLVACALAGLVLMRRRGWS
jgi:hypothetical protein